MLHLGIFNILMLFNLVYRILFPRCKIIRRKKILDEVILQIQSLLCQTLHYMNSCGMNFGLVWFMVFNATFNNISVILWRSVFFKFLSVLLIEETRVHGENHHPCLKSLTNFIGLSFIDDTSPWVRFQHTTLVVIGTDCIGDRF